MLTVDNNNIKIIRGDTDNICINFKQNGATVSLTEKDIITFSVKKRVDDADYILQKHIINNVLYFESDDTKNLEARLYVFDVQIKYENGKIQTPLSGTLQVLPDITREV